MYKLSKYTGFKEMLDGGLKLFTLKYTRVSFMIGKIKHTSEMSKQIFQPLILLWLIFIHFKIVTNTKNPKKIIENIDIGGPTLV